MKYADEIGSGAMTYIPSFIKIGSGIRKLRRGVHRQSHRQHGDLISLPLFFQNKEIWLKQRDSNCSKASPEFKCI
jgi:hypothetical protein